MFSQRRTDFKVSCSKFYITTFSDLPASSLHDRISMQEDKLSAAEIIPWPVLLTHILTLPGSPVSSEISDLCEISDLLLFVSYSASLSKGIKFGDYFFDVCCVN